MDKSAELKGLLIKEAKKVKAPTKGERAANVFLGEPLGRAMYAPSGHKLREFGKGWLRSWGHGLAGMGLGGAVGTGLGAATAALTRGKVKPAVMIGGLGGAYAGGLAGGIRSGYTAPEAMRKSIKAREARRAAKKK